MQKYAQNIQPETSNQICTDMQKYAIICKNMQTYKQKYVKIRTVLVKNAEICTKYLETSNKISKDMQKYAKKYARICKNICRNM